MSAQRSDRADPARRGPASRPARLNLWIPARVIVDGHLDIAVNVVVDGRDCTLPASRIRAIERRSDMQAMVGLPDLARRRSRRQLDQAPAAGLAAVFQRNLILTGLSVAYAGEGLFIHTAVVDRWEWWHGVIPPAVLFLLTLCLEWELGGLRRSENQGWTHFILRNQPLGQPCVP